MKKRFSVRHLTAAAVIAALYAALSLLSNTLGLTFGPVQLRVSEALTLLPFLFPGATWGLFIGCIVTNIISPYGMLDMIFGSLATLLAGFLTGKAPNRYLAVLPPVVCNMLIVSAVIAWQETGSFAGGAFFAAFAANAFSVGLGQAVICFGVGVPLLRLLAKYLHD